MKKIFVLWDKETKAGIEIEATKTGREWKALCPKHADKKPSLSINEEKQTFHCFGCSLSGSLYDPSKDPANRERPSSKQTMAAYDYLSEAGNLVFQTVRYAPKDFRQRRPDGKGGWIWNLKGVEPILYRLPELLNGTDPVFICEGEKDVDSLRSIDLTATTNPMGAGKWKPSFNGFLKGRDVVILPDNDVPGKKHGQQVAQCLLGTAQSIKIIHLPGLPEKGDVSDFLSNGGTKDDLIKIAESTEPFIPAAEKRPGIDLTLTTLEEVFHYEEPRYLIEPILIEGTANLLGGGAGKGKSLLTLSIIKSILTGERLWRKYPVITTGPVLLIDEETPRSFLRDRIERMGFDKTLPLYLLHFQDVRLDGDAFFDALLGKIEEVKPILVVFDSLIRIHRQPENDPVLMASVMANLRKIANTGKTVWVIHHHKKGDAPPDQKARGSTDIVAGVDVEYGIAVKDGLLTFSSIKTRVEPFGPIRLKLGVTDDGIDVVYKGTEKENILQEVEDILSIEERLGVDGICDKLKNRGVEVGINKLREVLNSAKDFRREGVKSGRTRKWVYSLYGRPSSPLTTVHASPPYKGG